VQVSGQAPPRVTIVIVTHDRAHSLRSAVQSVLEQDYPAVALLVVDDGSTDGTWELLGEYEDDPRVTLVRHASNKGVLAARNTALSRLTPETRYFGYLDSDDILLPGAVSSMVMAIEPDQARYSMVCAWCRDATTGVSQGRFVRSSGDVTLDDYVSGRLAGDFMELVRWELAEGLRYDERARGGEGVLLAQVLRQRPGLLIPDVVKAMDRSGTDRVSHVHYDRQRAEAQMRTVLFVLGGIGEELRAGYPVRYADHLREITKWATIAGHGTEARRASRQALRVDPSMRSLLTALFALLPARAATAVARARARRHAGRS
jgi:glycosyltransferase involved in cell wall biosynthesis